MDDDNSQRQPRTYRGARAIARRATQILGEPVSDDQIYQWKFKNQLRTFALNGRIATTETMLVEDLTGTTGKDAA